MYKRAVWLLIGFLLPAVSAAQSVSVESNDWRATFSNPTTRYGHGVLGDTPEWGRLCLSHLTTEACVTLEKRKVFEDIAPRLADLNSDGRLDAVVVESDQQGGASLVVYQLTEQGALIRVANKPIGTAFRWLAPAAIADLDEDGYVEIAYVDRPHLLKTLRVFRFIDNQLLEVASMSGLSNHRIGDNYISGGLRHCENQPLEIITADDSWRRIMAIRFDGGSLSTRSIGPLQADRGFERALACNPL